MNEIHSYNYLRYYTNPDYMSGPLIVKKHITKVRHVKIYITFIIFILASEEELIRSTTDYSSGCVINQTCVDTNCK